MPALPPHMASAEHHTVDEVVAMLKKTPLFMTSIDDADGRLPVPSKKDILLIRFMEDNLDLEAIRAMQYEGTALENSTEFKVQGNDMVKSKRWKDGQELNSKAMALLQKRKLYRKDSTINDEDVVLEERDLEAVCHVNRALCNLELSGFIASWPSSIAKMSRKLPINHLGLRTSFTNPAEERQGFLPLWSRSPGSRQGR